MQHLGSAFGHVVLAAVTLLGALSCSAGTEDDGTGGASATKGTGAQNGTGTSGQCNVCEFGTYVACDGTRTACEAMGQACVPTQGCVTCAPGLRYCVGNEVYQCSEDGSTAGTPIETCDVNAGFTCSDGVCKTGCDVAADQASNIGCEFWAVDLDQQDGLLDPASADWGVALSNTGDSPANITIQINEAPQGMPQQLMTVQQLTVPPNALAALILPIRELDCGTVPNDYDSPGTCLSSRAFRITSSSPIVVYQFNVFENAYSNDASLLLPTTALGLQYRVVGWGAGHPVFIAAGLPLDRSYITVVGTAPDTNVTVRPSWRIKGNPPIAATGQGGEIKVKIGPFDVLNLETDNATFQDDMKTAADLSGSLVFADKPIAVFSGVETTAVPGVFQEVPAFPGWDSMAEFANCCLDHLEEQLFPMESVGKSYVVTRSPVRSTTGYREPDVIRFVGAAEVANITTSLPAPDNAFTLQPGEVRTTWTHDNFTATSDKPFLIGQFLVVQGRIDGATTGDPDMTVFPPVDQYRNKYIIPTPGGWDASWVVISAEVGAMVALDGNPVSCPTEPAGMVDGKVYESRKCSLTQGVHTLTGDKPFGITMYGYGTAGSYALVGGADVKRIYEPPVPQ